MKEPAVFNKTFHSLEDFKRYVIGQDLDWEIRYDSKQLKNYYDKNLNHKRTRE